MFEDPTSQLISAQADSPVESAPIARPRRGFLRGLLGGLAAVPAVLAAGGTASAGRPNPNRLPDLYPRWNAREFTTILTDENQHVGILLGILGANARPLPTFRGLEMPTMYSFANLSRGLETTGVGAYIGAAPYINDPMYLQAAAGILATEAEHTSYVNVLLNQLMTMDFFGENVPVQKPLSIAQIVKNVSPFVVSLNGGPPLSFSTTRSDANDIAILNFALALEFLEATFYEINVPKFFY